MDIVRKIIRAYLYNPMPEKVQRQFRSWCLRERGCKNIRTTNYHTLPIFRNISVLARLLVT